MILLKLVCVFASIVSIASALNDPRSSRWRSSENSISDKLKPSEWISALELESLPSMREITTESLERMSLKEGAEVLQKMYHLSQAGKAFKPSFAPRASDINTQYITANDKKVSFKLNELPKFAWEEKDMGNQELTIYITGLPETTETVKKANRELVEAYMQRYNGNTTPNPNNNGNYDRQSEFKSEEEQNTDNNGSNSNSNSNLNHNKNHNSDQNNWNNGNNWSDHNNWSHQNNWSDQNNWNNQNNWSDRNNWSNGNRNTPSGNIMVIELGNTIGDMQRQAMLDIEKTGMEIGDVLVQLTDNTKIPYEVIHIIGSNIGAHVAGAAGRHFTKETGHKLRRITGLNPSKIFPQSKAIKGLARGDAEFVDAIHTSAYGMGTTQRSGDADFYPNGPDDGVPGANNVVEAAMRAVLYFAESVLPGNERNFPAVAANSLEQYKNRNGNGNRMHMGINTDHDAKGDYILEVNSKSPYGRKEPAQQQQSYHKVHKPWNISSHNRAL